MIELSNSKRTYLGKVGNKHRFALDCHIGAIQYKDNLGVWQDIAPKLVKLGNKYVSQGTPYLMEFDELGGRREYPDRYDLSKYISLPMIPLLRNLPKTFYQDRVVFTAPRFDLTMGLGKTGTFLEILFRQAPSFDRITFDAEAVGFDILKLLLSREGLGIPRPRLIDSSPEPVERQLDWSFKNGQLEVGFDFTGLTFPVLFKNSPLDVQVGASADDAHESEQSGAVSILGTAIINRSDADALFRYWGGHRFVSASLPVQGTTIDVAYMRVYVYSATYDDANFNIHFEELAAPAAFTTDVYNITGRDRSEASVAWIADGIAAGGEGWYNSPSLCGVGSPIQEVFDAYSPTAMVIITRPNQDVGKRLYVRAWDNTTDPANTWGAILHLEWEEAGEGVTATPPTINFAIGETQSTLSLSQTTSSTSLNIGTQIPYYDRGFIPPTRGLNTTPKNYNLNRVSNRPSLTLTLLRKAPIQERAQYTQTIRLITGASTPVIDRGYYILTIDLKASHKEAYLHRNIVGQLSSLGLGLETPLARLGYVYIPAEVALALGLEIPDVSVGIGFVATIVTPSTILLMLQTFAPELFSGVFPISITGRYGIEPSASWEGILTGTGRYGINPSVSNEGILTTSGRYGGG